MFSILSKCCNLQTLVLAPLVVVLLLLPSVFDSGKRSTPSRRDMRLPTPHSPAVTSLPSSRWTPNH